MVAGGEILRVDKQGLHYNGQTVADGGAAHDAWMATVKLMHGASFLGVNVTPQALREFVEWASEIFARYTSLKPDAGDTPEAQEETAESIQRDQAYLDAFVATCKEAQGMQQSALETSRRSDLEENQRKNNVALDTLITAVDEMRKENDALRAELGLLPKIVPAPGWPRKHLADLAAERDAFKADLAKARAELRVARHALGIEYDIQERTVAESIEIMKKDWQMERSHVTKLIFEGADLKKERDGLKARVDIAQAVLLTLRQSNRDLTAERDALNTAENRRAIGLDMPASSNAEILRLHIAFDDLKERYESLRNPAGATIADGGEWTREEASEMHRRKAEALLKVTAERDAAKRELAEMSAALDVVLRERTDLRLQIDRWRSWSSTTDGEARA